MIPDQQLRRSDIATARAVMRKQGISNAELTRRLCEAGVRITQPAVWMLFNKTPKNPRKPTRNELADALDVHPKCWKHANVDTNGAIALVAGTQDFDILMAAQTPFIPLDFSSMDSDSPHYEKGCVRLDRFALLFDVLYRFAVESETDSGGGWDVILNQKDVSAANYIYYGMMLEMIDSFMRATGSVPAGYEGRFSDRPEDRRAQGEACRQMRMLVQKSKDLGDQLVADWVARRGRWSAASAAVGGDPGMGKGGK